LLKMSSPFSFLEPAMSAAWLSAAAAGAVEPLPVDVVLGEPEPPQAAAAAMIAAVMTAEAASRGQ
jgi:hypothetical protein